MSSVSPRFSAALDRIVGETISPRQPPGISAPIASHAASIHERESVRAVRRTPTHGPELVMSAQESVERTMNRLRDEFKFDAPQHSPQQQTPQQQSPLQQRVYTASPNTRVHIDRYGRVEITDTTPRVSYSDAPPPAWSAMQPQMQSSQAQLRPQQHLQSQPDSARDISSAAAALAAMERMREEGARLIHLATYEATARGDAIASRLRNELAKNSFALHITGDEAAARSAAADAARSVTSTTMLSTNPERARQIATEAAQVAYAAEMERSSLAAASAALSTFASAFDDSGDPTRTKIEESTLRSEVAREINASRRRVEELLARRKSRDAKGAVASTATSETVLMMERAASSFAEKQMESAPRSDEGKLDEGKRQSSTAAQSLPGQPLSKRTEVRRSSTAAAASQPLPDIFTDARPIRHSEAPTEAPVDTTVSDDDVVAALRAQLNESQEVLRQVHFRWSQSRAANETLNAQLTEQIAANLTLVDENALLIDKHSKALEHLQFEREKRGGGGGGLDGVNSRAVLFNATNHIGRDEYETALSNLREMLANDHEVAFSEAKEEWMRTNRKSMAAASSFHSKIVSELEARHADNLSEAQQFAEASAAQKSEVTVSTFLASLTACEEKNAEAANEAASSATESIVRNLKATHAAELAAEKLLADGLRATIRATQQHHDALATALAEHQMHFKDEYAAREQASREAERAAVARATTKLETSNAELLQRVRAVADARADEAAAAHAQNTELESAYERAQLQSAGVKRAAENIHTQFDEMQAAAASEREENQRKQAMSGALRRELALLRSHRNAEKELADAELAAAKSESNALRFQIAALTEESAVARDAAKQIAGELARTAALHEAAQESHEESFLQQKERAAAELSNALSEQAKTDRSTAKDALLSALSSQRSQLEAEAKKATETITTQLTAAADLVENGAYEARSVEVEALQRTVHSLEVEIATRQMDAEDEREAAEDEREAAAAEARKNLAVAVGEANIMRDGVKRLKREIRERAVSAESLSSSIASGTRRHAALNHAFTVELRAASEHAAGITQTHDELRRAHGAQAEKLVAVHTANAELMKAVAGHAATTERIQLEHAGHLDAARVATAAEQRRTAVLLGVISAEGGAREQATLDHQHATAAAHQKAATLLRVMVAENDARANAKQKRKQEKKLERAAKAKHAATSNGSESHWADQVEKDLAADEAQYGATEVRRQPRDDDRDRRRAHSILTEAHLNLEAEASLRTDAEFQEHTRQQEKMDAMIAARMKQMSPHQNRASTSPRSTSELPPISEGLAPVAGADEEKMKMSLTDSHATLSTEMPKATASQDSINEMRSALKALDLLMVEEALFTDGAVAVSHLVFVNIMSTLLESDRHRSALSFLFGTMANLSSESNEKDKDEEPRGVLSSSFECVIGTLSAMCTSNQQDVTEAVFRAFGSDERGGLSKAEVSRFLHITMVMSYRLRDTEVPLDAAHAPRVKRLASMATGMTESMFDAIDRDHDHAVNKEEFGIWLEKTLAAPSSTSTSSTADASLPKAADSTTTKKGVDLLNPISTVSTNIISGSVALTKITVMLDPSFTLGFTTVDHAVSHVARGSQAMRNGIVVDDVIVAIYYDKSGRTHVTKTRGMSKAEFEVELETQVERAKAFPPSTLKFVLERLSQH